MKIGIQTWGSEGDVRPFVALAGGLSEAGHEVTLAVTDVRNKRYTKFGERLGFSVRHVGHLDLKEEHLYALGPRLIKERNALKQIQMIVTRFLDPVTGDMLTEAKRLCEENELLIRHIMAYSLGVAAELKGLPCISLYTTVPPVPSKSMSPLPPLNFGKALNSMMWRLTDRYVNRLFKAPIDRMRRQEGLEPIKSVLLDGWSSQILNLIAVSPTLLPISADLETRFQVCGFMNIPEEGESWQMPESLERFLQEGSPPVFMTFGSILEGEPSPLEITQLMVDSALLAGCRAIIQSKWEEVSGIPERTQIYRMGAAPHQFIFPGCAAIVHAGGAGTIQSALKASCPSVVVAHASDQALWGQLLHRAGIAPKPLHRRSISADKLARAIRNVLDSPAMAEKTQVISRKMEDENGVKRAVELIDDKYA